MSVRSRLLFNHDYVGKLEDDPVGFAAALLRWLHTGIAVEQLESYGVKVEWLGHHSELDCAAGGEGEGE